MELKIFNIFLKTCKDSVDDSEDPCALIKPQKRAEDKETNQGTAVACGIRYIFFWGGGGRLVHIHVSMFCAIFF